LTTFNLWTLPALSQDISPLGDECSLNGVDYKKCDRVEMSNGFFDHYTDGTDFCTR